MIGRSEPISGQFFGRRRDRGRQDEADISDGGLAELRCVDGRAASGLEPATELRCGRAEGAVLIARLAYPHDEQLAPGFPKRFRS